MAIFAGDHPIKGVKVKRPPVASENLNIISHTLETVQDRR